jgi:hypothetical protein
VRCRTQCEETKICDAQWHCVDGLDFPNWATHRCPETATHYVHRMRLQLAEVLVTQNAYT